MSTTTKTTYRLEYTPHGRTERRIMRSDVQSDVETAARMLMLSPECDPLVVIEMTTTTYDEVISSAWRTHALHDWRTP